MKYIQKLQYELDILRRQMKTCSQKKAWYEREGKWRYETIRK
jgi:hypothetical protein